jgi:hypothetical protein
VNTALSVLALLVALAALGRQIQVQRRPAVPARDGDPGDLPADALGLRHEVAALREEAASTFQHLAVVRYDAYGDLGAMGGGLSWTLALLDARGDGVLITSIHGRTEARTYAKTVADWACDVPLSPEEDEALERARVAG